MNNSNRKQIMDHEKAHKLLVELRELESASLDADPIEHKKLQRKMERIRAELLEPHMPMIHSLAKKYYNKKKQPIQYNDLVTAGITGFMKKLPKYFNKPVDKFSSWIYFAVRKEVYLQLGGQDNSSTKMPAYLMESLSKVVTCALQLYQETKTYPTIEEVAKAMHISPKLVEVVLNFKSNDCSGDKHMGEENDSFTLFDTIPEDSEGPYFPGATLASEYGDKQALHESLMQLPDLQFYAVTLKFGSSVAYECGLEKIITEFKSPQSRVRELHESLIASANGNTGTINSINIFFSNLQADRPSDELLRKLNIE